MRKTCHRENHKKKTCRTCELCHVVHVSFVLFVASSCYYSSKARSALSRVLANFFHNAMGPWPLLPLTAEASIGRSPLTGAVLARGDVATRRGRSQAALHPWSSTDGSSVTFQNKLGLNQLGWSRPCQRNHGYPKDPKDSRI